MATDAIDQFIALPQDQQIATLQALPSDRQTKLLAEVKERRTPLNTKLTRPMPPEFQKAHPLVSAASDFGGGAINAAEQVVTHPIQTAKGTIQAVGDIGNVAWPQAAAPGDAAASRGRLKNQLDFFKAHPAYSVGGLVGGSVAGEGLGEVAGATARVVPAAFKRGVELTTQTGPRETAKLVEKTKAGNAAEIEKAATANTKAAQEHLEETQSVLHETQGRELKYKQDVQNSNDEARTANEQADKAHAEAVQNALNETREKEDLYKADLRKAKAESDEAYQTKLKDVEEKRSKAEQNKREELRKYFEKKAKIQADHSEALDKYKSERSQQERIQPTQQKLKTAWSNLRARIETAREGALKIGNSKYSGVNEALNGLEADPEMLPNALSEATESLRGSKEAPPLLKSMEKRIQKGDVPTYEDLQGDYSTLGKELSKGTLPGDVFHAYDQLHEAIGDEMQRIADSEGQGEQLAAARSYWRRMKQTFGKPLSVTDAASKALKGSASGLAAEDLRANQIRLLGSFDKEIPGLFNHVSNIEKGSEALPAETPQRVQLRSLAESRKPLPNPPSARAAEVPNPAPVAPREIAQPARAPIPERPMPIAAKPIAPPERVAPPNRPPEVQPKIKALGTEDIREAKTKGLREREETIRRRGEWIALGVAGYQLLRNAANLKFGEIPGNIAEGGVAVAGVAGVAKLLENPKLVRLLTEPTARDLAQIPPEMRSNLGPVIKAAQSKGIKVSPALIAAVGAGAATRLQHPTLSPASPVQ